MVDENKENKSITLHIKRGYPLFSEEWFENLKRLNNAMPSIVCSSIGTTKCVALSHIGIKDPIILCIKTSASILHFHDELPERIRHTFRTQFDGIFYTKRELICRFD